MVPTMVPEMRDVTVTEYKYVTQPQDVTTYRCVPKVTKVPYEYTECVPTMVNEKVDVVVCKPVTTKEDVTYNVMERKIVHQKGQRTVCKTVPTVVQKPVVRDMGCWEDRCVQHVVHYSSGCGHHHRHGCGCCYDPCCGDQIVTTTQRVWVPRCVTVMVPCTVYQTQYVTEPYEYDTVVCNLVPKTEKVDVTRWVRTTEKRDVTCAKYVNVVKKGSYDVTSYETVAEKKKVDVTTCVAVPVKKQIAVQVCKLVPQKVTVQVPIQVGCGGPVVSVGCGH